MPKIRTPVDLLKLLATVFLSFLAIKGVISISGREGVLAKMTPSHSNWINAAIDNITVVMGYLMLFVLFVVAIWALLSFLMNRNKPKELSDEVRAIQKLGETLDSTLHKEFSSLKNELKAELRHGKPNRK